MVFCKKCQKEMADGKPFTGSSGIRAYFVLNFGTTLIGEAASYNKCHSYIATKWFIMILPLFPLASYRLSQINDLETGKTSYTGKQVPLYKPHLFAMLAAYAGLFLCLLYGFLA
jgi:hypothetical protein